MQEKHETNQGLDKKKNIDRWKWFLLLFALRIVCVCVCVCVCVGTCGVNVIVVRKEHDNLRFKSMMSNLGMTINLGEGKL